MNQTTSPRIYLEALEQTYATLLTWDSPLALRRSTLRELRKMRKYVAKVEGFDHTHGDFAPRETPELILQLRNHVRITHEAGSGWAASVSPGILHEWHNIKHGRDAHGVAFDTAPVEGDAHEGGGVY